MDESDITNPELMIQLLDGLYESDKLDALYLFQDIIKKGSAVDVHWQLPTVKFFIAINPSWRRYINLQRIVAMKDIYIELMTHPRFLDSEDPDTEIYINIAKTLFARHSPELQWIIEVETEIKN